jgi:non-canonical (house-cleaning) NTP pyrophosphatase
MVKGYSGVWEQPVGFYMDSTGAANRIRCGQELEPDAHYWVGIENMIGSVALRGSTKWFDMACVIVRHKSGLESISISTGIEFPEAVVREAEKIGFDTTTVGSLIAKHYGCDGKNPHLFLTSFLLGRVEILEQAVTAALGQLIFQMKLAGVNYL